MSYSYQKAFRLTDIYSAYWDDYVSMASRKLKLDGKHFKAVNYTLACRTSKMGYHYFKCMCCEHRHYLYHSCKHRFCGSCGSADTHRWAEGQLSRLLDMKHYHIVFTLPPQLRGLMKANEKLLYGLLFRSSQQALQDWFSSRHGLKCGIVSVLHTAGSDLKYHPHIHAIVSGGGLDRERGELRELPGDYLVNHKHLRKEFCKAFISGLERLHSRGELRLSGRPAIDFVSFCGDLGRLDWIISVQPPLADRRHIVRYVGRYTKRACLSEYRICHVGEGLVGFSFRDYRNSPREGPVNDGYLQLGYADFLDRLLRHVPDPGFHMVRYYGAYSNRYRSEVRDASGDSGSETESDTGSAEGDFGKHEEYWHEVCGGDALVCKSCNTRLSYMGQRFPPKPKSRLAFPRKTDFDDSG